MEFTEQKLKYLAEAMPGVKAFYLLRGQRLAALYQSPALLSAAGPDGPALAQTTKNDALDAVVPQDRSALLEALRHCVETRGAADCRWRVRFSYSRSPVGVGASVFCCGEMDGAPVLFVLFGADGVTPPGADALLRSAADMAGAASKQLPAGYAAGRQSYVSAVENAGFCVWHYDVPAHRLTDDGHGLEHFGFGDTVEDVPAALLPLCLPEDRKKLRELFRRTDAGEAGATADIWMREKPDAPSRCRRFVSTPDAAADGGPATAWIVSTDVTEPTLERSRYRKTIRSLLSSRPDAIGTYRLNLTQNRVENASSPLRSVERALRSDTADGFFEHVASYICDEEEKRAYLDRCSREADRGAAERRDHAHHGIPPPHRRRGDAVGESVFHTAEKPRHR